MFPPIVNDVNDLSEFFTNNGFEMKTIPGMEMPDVSLAFLPGVVPRYDGQNLGYAFAFAAQTIAQTYNIDALKKVAPDVEHGYKDHRGLRMGYQLDRVIEVLKKNEDSSRAILNFLSPDPWNCGSTLMTIQVRVIHERVHLTAHYRFLNISRALTFEIITLNMIAAAVAAELETEVGMIVVQVGQAVKLYDEEVEKGAWFMSKMFLPDLNYIGEWTAWGEIVNDHIVHGILDPYQIGRIFFDDDPTMNLRRKNASGRDADDDNIVVSDVLSGGKVKLAGGIEFLSEVQAVVSGMVPGCISNPPTNGQIVEAAYAMIEEVHELVKEVGWKSWKANPVITDELVKRITDEYADVLAFQGLLTHLIMLRTGINAIELAEAYESKVTKNIKRFLGESGESGYIGVQELSERDYNNG